MFHKPFSFRRKVSDESRQPRFQRTTSQAHSHESSPSNISEHSQEHRNPSPLPLPTTSSYLHTRKHSDHIRRNSGHDPGPLGLNVVYTPEHSHKVDIVFVHGLGGTSRRTWSKNEDPELFWPLKFLPLEPDVCLTRILTFGYDANFRSVGNVSTSVLDFAKDLLFDLKYAKGEEGEDLHIGNVPLVFVVHSMGGLIIKEAYMQGQNDPEYETIIKAISAITFLATPHRGTNLAELLDRILRSTIITNSKIYISELAKNSFTLQKLNEQFRHIAPRLDIVSFYETRSTSIGLKSARRMILEKDSSVLGYPGETSKALNADHHNVCKYDSPRDPNYITVRNALRSLVSKITSASETHKPQLSSRKASQDLKSLLAITELPDVDYIFFQDQWAQGTNDWLFENKIYQEWTQSQDTAASLLWLHGGAGTGKSVLSSFIINSFAKEGLSCQYFFIRFADQRKRTLSLLLRSIAYQIARSMHPFLQKVLQLMDEAINFETADPRTIWEHVFKSILFNMEDGQTLYWVIDGLDEAYDPSALIRLLSDLSLSTLRIRVLLVSRRTLDIETSFQRATYALKSKEISVEGHVEDLRHFIRQELHMSGTSEFKNYITGRLIEGAQNNFLWVRLAIDKLNLCHSQADVELALQELPMGMEALYDRMASTMAQHHSETDLAFALTILQCVTCASRILNIEELSQAVHDNQSGMLDFQRSMVNLCGGFVVVDNGGNVTMIHQTAREYLLCGNDRPLNIDRDAAHKHLFLSCMRCLMTVGLRARVKGRQKPEYLDYAATSWSSHLIAMSVSCEQSLEVLIQFLTGNWVLTWIQVLAAGDQLRVLIRASKHLSKLSSRLKNFDQVHDLKDHHIIQQELIKSWAEDFVKIIGKFGMILRENHESIHKTIPPFCPHNSAIYQQFGKTKDRSLVVSGLSIGNWDDSIARISFGSGTYASSISAAGAQIAILISSGTILLHDASIFDETLDSPINHGERVYRMQLNSAGTLLATYGYLTTKIWETSNGRCKLSVQNIEARPRPLTMLLTNNSTVLLVGSDDRRIRSLNIDQSPPEWQLVAELEEPELEGHFLNSSNHMALSKDGRLIVVAYRGHPLSAWEIEGPVHIGHCWRKREKIARGEVVEAIWQPHYPEVLGLYIEGVVFRWRPYDDENDEISTGASKIALSGDGNLFATGDVRGRVKVYTTSDFCLMYQLVSADPVLGLVFSPDIHRFYDIRGFYGNAWEPNVLMRFAEQRGKDIGNRADIDSLAQSSTSSESWSERVDSITVVAGSPAGRLYSYGTEKGAVYLYDTKHGKISDLRTSKSFLSIEQIAWSQEGDILCFSDSSKKLSIISISPEAGTASLSVQTTAETSLKSNTTGPLLQLLCHANAAQLLVRSSSTLCTISLSSKKVTSSLELDTSNSKWILHPTNPGLLVGVEPHAVNVFDWSLTKHHTYVIDYAQISEIPLGSDELQSLMVIDRVLVAHSKKHVLVQMSSSNLSSKEKTLFYFATSSWAESSSSLPDLHQAKSSRTITPSVIPRDLSSKVAFSLAVLAHDNFIFLSNKFTICSWRLPSSNGFPMSSSFPTPGFPAAALVNADSTNPRSYTHDEMTKSSTNDNIKALFYLPGDWISRDCLEICNVWSIERSLLCPRNGEVAVVRCSAMI